MALASNIHMSLLGKKGLREVALQSHAKAEYLKGEIATDPGLPAPVRRARRSTSSWWKRRELDAAALLDAARRAEDPGRDPALALGRRRSPAVSSSP